MVVVDVKSWVCSSAWDCQPDLRISGQRTGGFVFSFHSAGSVSDEQDIPDNWRSDCQLNQRNLSPVFQLAMSSIRGAKFNVCI